GLITGYTPAHRDAEQSIAKWKGAEASVLLPSGYQANLAAVQTLAAVAEARGKMIRFLIDRLVHASLIDAVRATGADMRVFPHNNLSKLERLLTRATQAPALQVVITESIFSMDGNAADLRGIRQLKANHPFTLLLDEAHGSGVYGTNGAGYASQLGISELVDVSIVTLSKAMGLAGGAICASKLFCDGVLNHGRAYIYSTSTAPSICEAVPTAIAVMGDEPNRQARVRTLAKKVRNVLAVAGEPNDSPIIPIILGEEKRALDAAKALRAEGFVVVAVRPPTVPCGSSRLRVTLSCDHSDEEVDALIRALKRA
ncbi:MAG TPA: aminotransferase class I/II-fold pyridoxal phosphate-dependent enzyme, partial [Tepidisphaeraceae bacterium]|nr:aminotransferase class I/II-fold pyridoxal phosphate-dependent enzyme [Tepidisphaeraceae bacterium]